MFCSQCGTSNAEGSRFCTNCGAALLAAPATPPSAPPVVAGPPQPEYAGFWRRFAAVIIDGLILSIPGGLIFALFMLPTISAICMSGDEDAILSMVLSSIFSWIWLAMLIFAIRLLYFALFESSRFQATPGKLALGIIVTDMQGRPVSFPRALGRNLGKILSKLILNIGFIMAGITVKKQALHDILADCLVVMK